jgi:Flp pilus assembly protein TadG
MTGRVRNFWRGRESEAGASAIEFALALPMIMMLFALMIDLTLYVSASRKVTSAANILTDITTQHASVITAATIDDAFAGAKLALRPISGDEIGLEIRNYRMSNEKLAQQWSRKAASGPSCAFSDTSTLDTLTKGDNDIIIAAACFDYKPVLAKMLGISGVATLHVDSEVSLRPRESNTLNCSDC